MQDSLKSHWHHYVSLETGLLKNIENNLDAENLSLLNIIYTSKLLTELPHFVNNMFNLKWNEKFNKTASRWRLPLNPSFVLFLSFLWVFVRCCRMEHQQSTERERDAHPPEGTMSLTKDKSPNDSRGNEVGGSGGDSGPCWRGAVAESLGKHSPH